MNSISSQVGRHFLKMPGCNIREVLKNTMTLLNHFTILKPFTKNITKLGNIIAIKLTHTKKITNVNKNQT